MEKVLRQNEASAQFPLQNIRSYFKYYSLTDFGKTEHFRNQIGVFRGQNDQMLLVAHQLFEILKLVCTLRIKGTSFRNF